METFVLAVFLLVSSTVALENGLARTPPMGYLFIYYVNVMKMELLE